MENSLVSIIMPCYNCEKYINASIKSVLGQTYKEFELIIVDDCSTDCTLKIIKSFFDPRIRLYVNNNNIGAAFSRNKGLQESKGKYIAFIDADDIWDLVKLEKQINYMVKNNYNFTFTDYRIQHNGIWEEYIRTGPRRVNYRKIINYCYFFTSTVIYNREVVGLIQIQDLKKNNDYAMWLHAIKKTDAYRYPYCLSYYIKHNDSISGGSKTKLIKYHYLLFRIELKKSKIIAILLTINNLWHGFWKKQIYKKRIVH